MEESDKINYSKFQGSMEEFGINLDDLKPTISQTKKPKKSIGNFDFIQNALKNCGTGSGGFQAGNSCATGGGSSSSITDVKSFGSRKTAPSESVERLTAIFNHLSKTPENELKKEVNKIFSNCGFDKATATTMAGRLVASMNRTVGVLNKEYDAKQEHLTGLIATYTKNGDTFAAQTIERVAQISSDRLMINTDVAKSGAMGYVAGLALYSEVNGASLLGFNSKDFQISPFEYNFISDQNTGSVGNFARSSETNRATGEVVGWKAKIELNTYALYHTVSQTMNLTSEYKQAGEQVINSRTIPAMGISADRSGKYASGAEQPQHMSALLAAMAQNPKVKNSDMEFDSIGFNGGTAMSVERTAALMGAHTAIHEIAHAAHFGKLMSENDDRYAKASYKMSQMGRSLPTVSGRLSSNTKRSQTEFVADIFAGLVLGATYKDDVYTQYQKLSAPTRKIPTDKNVNR